MMLSKQPIDWVFVDEDLPPGSERLLFAESHNREVESIPPDPQKRSTLQSRIYELAIVFVCIYTLAAFLAWQVVERRMSGLEDEVLVLSSELVKAQSGAEADSAVVEAALPAGRQTLETELLRFEFAEANAESMQAVAARSDAKYRELHAAFGLALPTTAPKLTIAVVEPSAPYSLAGANTLRVPVPAAAAQQGQNSTAEALQSAIHLHMTRHILAEAIATRNVKRQWHSLVGAIQYRLWADTNHDGERRHDELHLARRHAAQTKRLDLTTNSVIAYDEQDQGQELLMHTLTADEVADPLIEYILATYGHASIGPLLDAFEQHESWATLVPALFQMSAAELETQWHDYLAQQYPLPEPN